MTCFYKRYGLAKKYCKFLLLTFFLFGISVCSELTMHISSENSTFAGK